MSALDLNLLVVLAALLEHGSTVETAKRLGRTQSAISHSLARLRETFDDELFVRIGRTMRPTPRAEQLRAPLAELLAAATALVDGPRDVDPARLERTFRIGATDWAERVIAPPLLSELPPGVRLELLYLGDAAEDLVQSGAVDLCLGTGFRERDGVFTQRLFAERFVGVARRGHRVGKRPSRERYLAERHVVVAPRALPGSRVDSSLARGERRDVAVRTPSFGTAAALVGRTDLLSALPETFARAVAAEHRLTIFELPIAVAGFSFQQIFARTLRDDPAHAWLRAKIAEVSAALR